MTAIQIPTRAVRSIVDATFPDYKRRTVWIEATDHVTLHDLNWSGGTRNEYRACRIDGSERSGDTVQILSSQPPWSNPFEGQTVPVPEGTIIVRGGDFCGKVGLLKLHVHPNNMPKLLPGEIVVA